MEEGGEMTVFLRLLRLEMRSLWVPLAVWIVVMTTAWFLVPTYLLWSIVCYVFALGGIVIKFWQCRRDYKNKNYAVLYSLPMRRSRLLAARYVSGTVASGIIYAATMTVMHLFDRFNMAQLMSGPAEELAAYNEPSNYLMRYCTDRSGMMSLDAEIIVRVILGLAFISLCIEVLHIATQSYPIVFLIFVVSNLLMRFMLVRIAEGTPVMMYLTRPMAMPITLLYYGVNTAIGLYSVRGFYTGYEGKSEAYEYDAGATSF